MADSEGHIGTLLANLQSMRHLTTIEMRLLQISDEYLLLREFTTAKSKSTAGYDMSELIDHLKEQLALSSVPIPDPLALDVQQGTFGLELLTKQFNDVMASLKSSEPNSNDQLQQLKQLDDIIFTDASASSACSLGLLDMAISAVSSDTTAPLHLKSWLRMLCILSSFPSGRNPSKKEAILRTAVSFATGKEISLQEHGMWILANYSDAATSEDQALLGQTLLVHLVPIIKNPNSNLLLQHALRCLTNLAIDASNRKVIDAWIGLDVISGHLDSNADSVCHLALWCISHLASEQLSHSFEKSTKLVNRICQIATTRGVSPGVGAAAWRSLANLLSMPSLRTIILSNGAFDYAQNIIVAELEEIEMNPERDLAMLQEAVAFAASVILRDETLRDAVSNPLLHNFLRLMNCNSAAIRAQAMWAVVYLSVSDKNHTRILTEGGLDIALDLLDGEEQEQNAAAWLLCNFAGNDEYHDRLRENGALISLVKLLFSKSQDVRLVAGKALARLSAHNKNKTLIKQLFATLSLKDGVLSNQATSPK